MSVGPWNPVESAVIYLPEKADITNPGSELVAISRVTDIPFLTICDKLEVVTGITKETKSTKCYRLKIVSRVRFLKRI